MKGKVSTKGYKKDSPDKDNDFNIIPSNTITMHDVMHHVLGIDDKGNMKLMKPEHDYVFEGKKVLELPIKNNSMKKTPQIENFQDLLNLMEAGGPIVLQYPIDRMLPVAQDGNQGKIKTVGKPAQAAAEEQKLARQYNFEGLPGETERSTWNKFLEHVGKQYPVNSEEAKKLNYGKPEEAAKKFEELYTGFNTQNVEALKQQYARVKSAPTFDKSITEEQFIKARQVNPDMMKNAQKFYGQQTAKDAWFGSETAQSFYPTISGMAQSYANGSPEQIAQANRAAANKLTPVQITPYGSKTVADYKGAATIKGYDAQGRPIIDYSTTKPFTSEMASNVYFDPGYADTKVKAAFAPYLPQTSPTVAPTTTVAPRKLGGSPFTKGSLKSILEGVMKKQFGGSTAPQGMDTNSYIADKKNTFAKSLRKNAVGHMLQEEVMGIMKSGGGIYQEGGEPEVLPMNMTTIPEINMGDEDIRESNLNVPAQDIMKSMQTNFLDNVRNVEQKKRSTGSAVATGVMGIMDLYNSAAERARADAYLEQSQIDARNRALTTTVAGSQGNTDINDASFRANKAGMPTYQKGGERQKQEKFLKDYYSELNNNWMASRANLQGKRMGPDVETPAMQAINKFLYHGKTAELSDEDYIKISDKLIDAISGQRKKAEPFRYEDFTDIPELKVGGSYHMTQEEMVQFMRMGGQIKFID